MVGGICPQFRGATARAGSCAAIHSAARWHASSASMTEAHLSDPTLGSPSPGDTLAQVYRRTTLGFFAVSVVGTKPVSGGSFWSTRTKSSRSLVKPWSATYRSTAATSCRTQPEALYPRPRGELNHNQPVPAVRQVRSFGRATPPWLANQVAQNEVNVTVGPSSGTASLVGRRMSSSKSDARQCRRPASVGCELAASRSQPMTASIDTQPWKIAASVLCDSRKAFGATRTAAPLRIFARSL